MAPLSEEEENYVRMCLLLTGVSPRAVRCQFDKEFAPVVLPTTIRKEYSSLYDLYRKRVINQAQLNVLQPRNGAPDSKNFDVTLMICLLRNLTTITPPSVGYDRLPPSGEKTQGADIARIKYYRNYLAHLDDTKIDNSFFSSAWTDVSESQEKMKHFMEEMKGVKESLVGLQRDIKEEVEIQKESHRELKISYDGLKSDREKDSKEIEDLVESYVSLKSDHDEKTKKVENLSKSYLNLKTDNETLEKSYVSLKTDHDEKTKNVEMLADSYASLKLDNKTLAKAYVNLKRDHDQKGNEIDKLKAAHKDPVPWNIREQINRKLETWKKDDEMFIDTRAAKHVLECLKTHSCITVTGSFGMGKTFTVRHVALRMAEDGYVILPVTNTDDIEKFYNPETKTIFVIDNFCGTYTLNQNVLDKWKLLNDTITDILDDKKTKIIVSCRSQVYQDDMFQILSLFNILGSLHTIIA